MASINLRANHRDRAVIVTLASRPFALQATSVVEMVSLPGVHAVPGMPSHIRGVINLRGRVMPLVDLRLRMGLPPAESELQSFSAIFDARADDHRRWIEELERCLHTGDPFMLATDPHECAFGKWYDGLKSDNVVLATHLRRIDVPHQAVHRRGAEALAARAAGGVDAALAIAAHLREHELERTLAMLADAKTALREAHREIAVVLQDGGRTFAVVVDGVESVEMLVSENQSDCSNADIPGDALARLGRVRKRAKDGQLVIEIDVTRVISEDEMTASGQHADAA